MLKVFHTADWHLGQTFCGYDRDYEHTAFLNWLLSTLERERPDALLVSGDVFDTINPSALSQRRYYQFLAQTARTLPELQIVITAGNHDAAARLEAPSSLLRHLNITVVGTVTRNENEEVDLKKFLVPLKDRAGITRAIVLAVPFLRPSDVPYLPDETDAYLGGIRELYRQLTVAAKQLKEDQYPEAAIVAMGHCHIQGGTESVDSERRLVIGGAEALGVDLFDDSLAYVALGHLHKAQQFRDGKVRYSGSPIPLSFSESSYQHRVFVVSLAAQEPASVSELLVPRAIDLMTVPPGGAAVLADLLPLLHALPSQSNLPPEQQPFLEVHVQEDQPDPTRRKQIEDALKDKPVRLASIKLRPVVERAYAMADDRPEESLDLQKLDPEHVFMDAYREKYQAEPDPAIVAAFRAILMKEVPSA